MWAVSRVFCIPCGIWEKSWAAPCVRSTIPPEKCLTPATSCRPVPRRSARELRSRQVPWRNLRRASASSLSRWEIRQAALWKSAARHIRPARKCFCATRRCRVWWKLWKGFRQAPRRLKRFLRPLMTLPSRRIYLPWMRPWKRRGQEAQERDLPWWRRRFAIWQGNLRRQRKILRSWSKIPLTRYIRVRRLHRIRRMSC